MKILSALTMVVAVVSGHTGRGRGGRVDSPDGKQNPSRPLVRPLCSQILLQTHNAVGDNCDDAEYCDRYLRMSKKLLKSLDCGEQAKQVRKMREMMLCGEICDTESECEDPFGVFECHFPI